jgi:hypothetical protein
MTQNELPPGETGILRALHNGTDERQWQAVLALALTEDLANARAFVEAVLRSAAQDKTGGRRAADLLDRLPDTVRVSTEQRRVVTKSGRPSAWFSSPCRRKAPTRRAEPRSLAIDT